MRLCKTLKSSTRRWLAPLFIAGVTGVLLASCAPPARNGDNVAQINEAPLPSEDAGASLLQGYVSQTRVSGAPVWIDGADASGNHNNTLDFGETSGTTSNNGLFSLTQSPLDESNNYRIVTLGGTARSVSASAEAVGVMLAPRGAKNVTPLTTVVALNNELAAKIGQSLLSSSSQSYSESYDVDIAKSGGTFGEHLQLAKGIETFMYVFGRTNPDLPLISSTQGHIDALQILADNLNELDSASLFNASNIATKIGEAATDTLQSTTVDSLITLSTADQAAIKADVQGAATAVMDAISTGSNIKRTEASIISACSDAFAASDLVANKTLSTKAGSLPPYASSVTIADETASLIYNSGSGDFTLDDDQSPDNITIAVKESLSNGASLNIDNITFTITDSVATEIYTIDNVTFAKSNSGLVNITINNTPSCDITTSGSSFILNYDNVTISCNTGSTQNSLVDTQDNGTAGNSGVAAGNTRSGTITMALIDATSDNLSKSFELNLTD